MNFEDFRTLALTFPGVEEGIAYGTPIWRVKKRMLTRVWEDLETVVLKMDLSFRDTLVEAQPNVFFVTDHYRGHPYILARLSAADPDQIHSILQTGWKEIAPKRKAQ
jgi:hypothetical protein